MPRYARRRTARRRTPYRGRRRITRRYVLRRGRRMSTNLHTYRRWEPFGSRAFTVTTDATGSAGTGFLFRLNLTDGFAELGALYDAYRILQVTLVMSYAPETSASLPASAANYPEFFYKRDYDDATGPTASVMQQSNQTRIWRPTQSRTTKTVKLKPAVRNIISGDAGNTATTTLWRPWIDMVDSAANHYGFKILARGAPSTAYGILNVRVCYLIQCKNVR